MDKIIRVLISQCILAICICAMIGQIVATVFAVSSGDIKFYHDPISAFVGLEMIVFISGISLITVLGLYRITYYYAWVYLLCLVLVYVLCMFTSLFGLIYAITGAASISVLLRIPMIYTMPIVLIILAGYFEFGKKIKIINWLGVCFSVYPIAIQKYTGVYSGVLSQPDSIATVLSAYWAFVLFYSARHIRAKQLLFLWQTCWELKPDPDENKEINRAKSSDRN